MLWTGCFGIVLRLQSSLKSNVILWKLYMGQFQLISNYFLTQCSKSDIFVSLCNVSKISLLEWYRKRCSCITLNFLFLKIS